LKNVSIVGLGYVGLPLALLAASKGYRVTGIDLSQEKISKINQRQDPINDEYVSKNIAASSLKASPHFNSIKNSAIVIICVPTPVKHDYQPDLSPLKAAATSVAKKIGKGSLVIIESTINPGVCDDIIIPLLEKQSGLKINKDFFVSHCPERINPGDTKWNVENIPRVTGSSNKEGLDITVKFYKSIINAEVKPMGSIKEAEAVKVVENSFRDVNIAFVNELAMSFTKLGIDVNNVIDGAATKPFAFMAHYPSVGVGGHCIPVDPYYLIEYARGYGFEHEFLSLARSINNQMPEFTVNQLIDALNEIGYTLKNSKVLVLGLSYKANVADDRESPSYKLIEILKRKGAKVSAYDPYLINKSDFDSLDKALASQDAIILAANHKSFLNLDPKLLKIKAFIDGKNSFDGKLFSNANIAYRGIGK
jgi:UDP-N-acetyl-D-glucosamine dehydrogenase